MIGETVSHYRILNALGKGGMGVVYLAEDTHLARRVAVKFPAADNDSLYRERFLREARAASALNHPHIAAIYDYGETPDGHPFLVMELVEGEDLRRALENGPIEPARAVEIGIAVAEALAEAHRHGIVHRDIKPSNILLGARGEVKVLDFGLAKTFACQPAALAAGAHTETLSHTQAGVIMGTPAYMAPEQLRGEPVGPQSDLFALGAVLYECLGGRPAFSGNTSVEILAAVLHVNPPAPSESNPRVAPEISRVVLKALAKSQAERYQTAEEMLADLRTIGQATHSVATGATIPLPADPSQAVSEAASPRTGARSPALLALAAGVVLATGFGAWWFLAGRPYQPLPQADRFYQDGLSALRDGTYFKASREFSEAARLDPKLGMAHAHLAEAALELEDARTAGVEFAKAGTPERTTRLTRADRDVRDAIRLTLAARFADAVNLYRDMVDRTPDRAQADALVDLGRAYERAQQPEDAFECYRKATGRDALQPAAWLRLGVQYGARKLDAADATPAFDKAEAIYRSKSNLEGIAEVEYQRGVAANKLGQIAEARALLEKALDLTQAAESPSQQILVLMQLSWLETNSSHAAEAQASASKALELARANGMENLTTNGLIDLGNAFLGKGDAAQARPYFQQALELARHYGSERSEFRALLSLGSLETQQGELDRGLADVRQALQWYQPRGYRNATMLGLTLLARIERDKGDYPSALESLQQQLKLAGAQGNQAQIALSQEGIGSVRLVQGLWSDALKAYRAQLQAATESGVTLYAQFGLVNCADLLWRLGRYQEVSPLLDQVGANRSKSVDARIARLQAGMALSRREFPKAAEAARRLLSVSGASDELQAELNSVLAMALASSGNRAEAARIVEIAGNLAARSGNPRRVAETELAQAELALAQGQSSVALQYAQAAQKWAALVGNTETEWRSWWLAARAAQASGRKSDARDFAQKASGLLAGLAQKWDPEDFRTYLARPDVEFAKGQLARLGVQ
ncbi:MAG: protein kinase [Bryobacteraceae bacterium]